MITSKHLDDQDISLFADALKLGRTSQLPSRLVEHVAGCTICKHQILQLYRIFQKQDENALGPHPYFDTPPKPSRGGRYLLYRIAAALALTVGIGGLLYYFSTRSGQQPVPTITFRPLESPRIDSSRKTMPPDASRRLLAENMVPNDDLESLVGMRTRSEGLHVVSPLNGDSCDSTTVFRWQTAGKTLHLEVVNNKGQEILRKDTTGSNLMLGEKLKAGLYYWMLRRNGELVYVGKFFVK